MSVFEGGGGLLMGHSDRAEASLHSPQHDSAPWGEGPSILTPALATVFSSQRYFLIEMQDQ